MVYIVNEYFVMIWCGWKEWLFQKYDMYEYIFFPKNVVEKVIFSQKNVHLKMHYENDKTFPSEINLPREVGKWVFLKKMAEKKFFSQKIGWKDCLYQLMNCTK